MKKDFVYAITGVREKPLLADAARLIKVGRLANNLKQLLECKMLLAKSACEFGGAYLAWLIEFRCKPDLGQLTQREHVRAGVLKADAIWLSGDWRREFFGVFVRKDVFDAGVGGLDKVTTPAPEGYYGTPLSDEARKKIAADAKGSGKRHTAGSVMKRGSQSRNLTAYSLDSFWFRKV